MQTGIIGLLEHAQIGAIDLIVNRIRADMVRRGDMMSLTDVQDILAVEYDRSHSR